MKLFEMLCYTVIFGTAAYLFFIKTKVIYNFWLKRFGETNPYSKNEKLYFLVSKFMGVIFSIIFIALVLADLLIIFD